MLKARSLSAVDSNMVIVKDATGDRALAAVPAVAEACSVEQFHRGGPDGLGIKRRPTPAEKTIASLYGKEVCTCHCARMLHVDDVLS